MTDQEKLFRARNPKQSDPNFAQPIIDIILKKLLDDMDHKHFTEHRHPTFTFDTYFSLVFEYDDKVNYLKIDWNDLNGGNGEITDFVLASGGDEQYNVSLNREEVIGDRIQTLLAINEDHDNNLIDKNF